MRDVQRLLQAVKPRPLTLAQIRENTSWTSPEISACLCKLLEAKRVSRFLPADKGTRGYAYVWTDVTCVSGLPMTPTPMPIKP
jgi:DNA-binding transcriptional regulator GbsR (MarR family)